MAKRHEPQSGYCVKCDTWRDHLHKDHITPKWQGGVDTEDNFQWLCANCHEDKTYAERKLPEYREMQRQRMKARMAKPEARIAVSEAVKRSNALRVWTPEMRDRCSRKGIKRAPFTEEHKARISASRKGMVFSPQHREALSKARRNWLAQEEIRNATT